MSFLKSDLAPGGKFSRTWVSEYVARVVEAVGRREFSYPGWCYIPYFLFRYSVQKGANKSTYLLEKCPPPEHRHAYNIISLIRSWAFYKDIQMSPLCLFHIWGLCSPILCLLRAGLRECVRHDTTFTFVFTIWKHIVQGLFPSGSVHVFVVDLEPCGGKDIDHWVQFCIH